MQQKPVAEQKRNDRLSEKKKTTLVQEQDARSLKM